MGRKYVRAHIDRRMALGTGYRFPPMRKNETAEVYVEKGYTRYLQWDKKLEMIIPSLATSSCGTGEVQRWQDGHG